MSSPHSPVISVMLAVPDAVRAVEWYERALGASQLWNRGIGPAAKEALPALKKVLSDPSAAVRRFAQRAIERIDR